MSLLLLPAARRVCLLLIIASSTLLSFSCATTTSSTTSAPTATATVVPTIYSPTSDWTYYGCYNETTLTNGTDGARALGGGVMESLTIMTVPICLDYCKANGYDFAGLEYSRECWCAQLLSSIAAKLPDSSCNLPCEGNGTQYCGGYLHLSVYEAKSSTKGAGIRGVREAPLESILALGIAMGVLLCLA